MFELHSKTQEKDKNCAAISRVFFFYGFCKPLSQESKKNYSKFWSEYFVLVNKYMSYYNHVIIKPYSIKLFVISLSTDLLSSTPNT